MIGLSWNVVAGTGLAVLGLAVLLAAFSLGEYRRGRKAAGGRLVDRAAVGLGAVLTCAGLALATETWWERGGWALLGAGAAVSWGRAARRSAPEHAGTGGGPVPDRRGAVGAPGRLRAAAAWVVRTELLWLALLAPFFLFPAPERVWALPALPLLWLARRLAHGRFVPRTPLDWPILALLAMVLVSLFATFDAAFSLGKVAGVLWGIGVYYALVEWAASPARLARAVAGYLLAGLGLAGLALVGAGWNAKFPLLTAVAARLPALVSRVPGAETGLSANEIAGALLWVLPVLLALAVVAWAGGPAAPRVGPAGRVGLVLATLGLAATLLLTQSRSALIGLGAGLLLLGWLAVPRARPALLGLVVVALVVALAGEPGAVAARLYGPASVAGATSGEILTLSGRTEIWLRALRAIGDFPLTGTGMNAFRAMLPVLYPVLSLQPQVDLAHAHNHLLQAALDLGLPGLVAYLAIWLLAALLAVQTWQASAGGWRRALAAGIGAGLLASFVYGLTDAVALGAKPGVLFWALLALLVAAWRTRAAPEPG